MNNNELFELTELWTKKLRDDLKSFYRTIYFGPPLFVLLNVIFCFSLKRGTDIGFWILFVPITMASTIYCIFMPRKAIKRYSNIIQTFEFDSANEMRLTLIDGRELILSKPEFKDDFFKVDNAEKACKSVVNISNKSNYTIIPEFFTHPPIL